ncbi:hypothetical protein MW887_009446 [Aspergillus wentii]|nr:hypothetical protein MW887_009446 [Aspergillus wentii]
MSCPPPSQKLIPAGFVDDNDDNSTDYGSDFTPDEVDELFAKVAPEHATGQNVPATKGEKEQEQQQKEGKEQERKIVGDIEDYYAGSPLSPRVPKVLGRERFGSPWHQKQQQQQQQKNTGSRPGQMPGNAGTASVEHPNSIEGRKRDRERAIAREKEWTKQEDENNNAPDLRSPIERFRLPPNKPFSVTDLISPAWCELQYWYTLTKFGRKRRTPAMKQGSTIHKTLEDEIYTTVSVEITTREDALALRIWNVIQGLRMLREYGITRELEVWGLVDGELVNGVIDQLSFECPDSDLEATAAEYYADVEVSRAAMPEYQMSLTDYLLSPSQGGRRLSDASWQNAPSLTPDDSVSQQLSPEVFSLPRVYMTDVKTRASNSTPTVKSSSFRPTLLQLQMYYHMLNRLVLSDDVTVELLASRYNLDPERSFTDAFITEVGGLNDQFFDALSTQDFDSDFIASPEDAKGISRDSDFTPPASQDSSTILLTHNNLSSLWKFMKDQLRLTFLPPPESIVAASIPSKTQPALLEPYPTVLSPLLTARYLSSAPTTDLQPRVLGSRSFLFDPTTLHSYLGDQMSWWRGTRDPRGVEVMEAWKCRLCDFRDDCVWREEREWQMANRKRGRRGSASRGFVEGVAFG